MWAGPGWPSPIDRSLPGPPAPQFIRHHVGVGPEERERPGGGGIRRPLPGRRPRAQRRAAGGRAGRWSRGGHRGGGAGGAGHRGRGGGGGAAARGGGGPAAHPHPLLLHPAHTHQLPQPLPRRPGPRVQVPHRAGGRRRGGGHLAAARARRRGDPHRAARQRRGPEPGAAPSPLPARHRPGAPVAAGAAGAPGGDGRVLRRPGGCWVGGDGTAAACWPALHSGRPVL